MTDSQALKQQITVLEERIRNLEREVEFLRIHPTIAQGLKGERFICQLTEGVATTLNASFDVETPSGVKIEVKFSKLNTPVKSSLETKRWTWSKPMGWLDKGKDYDFLLLVAEKDQRFRDQYLDDSPYVLFLLPAAKVPEVISSGKSVGANVNLTTNFRTVRSPAGRTIIGSMVPYMLVDDMLSNAITY